MLPNLDKQWTQPDVAAGSDTVTGVNNDQEVQLDILEIESTKDMGMPPKGKFYNNLYLQVVVYAIACLTTSCLYFGWQPFQEMLFRAGAYAWRCEPDWDYDIDGACFEQEKAVSQLYSFAQGTEFACGFVAGLLLDHVGPRWTAVLGEVLFAIAILLLSTSSQSFQMYIPAMMISGGCVNIVAFPSLVVTERWPTRQALAVSIIIGAQSGASVVAPILNNIWQQNPHYTYFGIWGVYLLAIWLPVSFIYVWALPTRRKYAKPAEEDVEHGASDANSALVPLEDSGDDEKPKIPTTSKEKWSAFYRDMKTTDFIICAIYTLLLKLQFAYYPTVVRDAVGTDVSEFIGWMTPLQAFASIFIGFVMDYTGTCIAMYAMCITLAIVSLSTGFAADNTGFMKFIAVFFVFMQSGCYNLKYTYVNEMYDPYNFGKLVGFLGIMGGVGVYIIAPISTSTAYREIFSVFAGLSASMAALTFFLHWRQLKGVSYKTLVDAPVVDEKSPTDTLEGDVNAKEP